MKRFFTPEHKKVIFFDMNDTLIDQQKTFDSGFLGLIREFTGRWEGQDGGSAEEVLAKYHEECKKMSKAKKKKSLTRDELRKVCLRQALSGLPIPESDTAIRHFFRDLRASRHLHASLFPGVRETLEQLSGRYKLAVISNGDKEQIAAVLERLRLSSLIPAGRVFASSQIGLSKPNPGMFQHALKGVGCKAAQAVMVGDSWKNDIYGATRAGMDAVWINPSHEKKISQRKIGKEKVVMVRRFEQLKSVF